MILQSEIASHLVVTFVYFFLVSLLRLGEFGRFGWGGLGVLGMLGMWTGAILGSFFLDIDHLLYWFFTHPEEEDSQEAREMAMGGTSTTGIKIITGKLRELYWLLRKSHDTHTRLILHSLIGQAVLLVMAVYLLTSGGSIFGSAFIMAINLHLLKDEWSDYAKDKNHLANWLFWQISDPKARRYLREYLVGVSLVFLLLTGLLI